MLTQTFDHEKALHTLLYIVQQLGQPGYHQAFKALYFAERRYMANYGNTIVGDNFVKMEAGPVPSNIYDIVKIVNGRNNDSRLSNEYKDSIKGQLRSIKPHYLVATAKPDMDFFAETEIQCLDEAIEYCRYKDFTALKELSHDAAWEAATLNTLMDNLKIAAAGGANEDTIKYLEESLNNSDYFSF
jgi:hypothetical protein